MCGRFALAAIPKALLARFGLTDRVRPPRYNIAPTQRVPVVVENNGERAALATMRWGLTPAWMRGKPPGPGIINARAETIDGKPAFREAFALRRCLVPASGFYEWRRDDAGKTPFYFTAGDTPLVFAGIWDNGRVSAEESAPSFAIITAEANDLMHPVHNRMPAILPEEVWDEWLDLGNDDTARLKKLLGPAPRDVLSCWPVGSRVNSVKHDDPECVAEIA